MTNETSPLDRLLADEKKMRELAEWALSTGSRLALYPVWDPEDNYSTTETFYALMRDWLVGNVNREEAILLSGVVDDHCPCTHSENSPAKKGGYCLKCDHSIYSHDVYGCFVPMKEK